MKIEMALVYDGVFEGESGMAHLLKDEGTGLMVEVPEDLLPKAFAKVANEFKDNTLGDGLPVTLTLEWPA